MLQCLTGPIIKMAMKSHAWTTTQINLPESNAKAFANWQARLNAEIAGFPGFVSFEISCQEENSNNTWTIVQRFEEEKDLAKWMNSKPRHALFNELPSLSVKELKQGKVVQGAVTEIFVTRVEKDCELDYRTWISKIHQAEAQFPGFKGMYLQSPASGQGENWISLLQFDTAENLDRWLSSQERKALLQEGEYLIVSLESHRMISPFAGWFSSLMRQGSPPPVWKQSLLILLVLFPTVMLEMKYLSLLTSGLN
ncbi:MAG: antibiotic biosynthesis monooxygenase, partial [Parachlamydia sp.]|nr:antibiotic biosynthesis monooxygenase [Parachlamydia sp.]